MRTNTIGMMTALGCVGLIGCAGTPSGSDAGNNFFQQDSGPNLPGDAGNNNLTDAGYTIVTVATAISGGGSLHSVEIDNVVVTAANIYTETSGATTETFYIQDSTGGAGISVYKGSKDTTVPTANVGDIVNVAGHLSSYNGSLQISTSTKYATPVMVTVVSAGTGHATSGAYPPAGTPTMVAASGEGAYDHNNAASNPTQVGTVVQLAGPLTVTDPYPVGFVTTDEDGGTKPQGFGVALGDGGELWVEDGFIYDTCLKGVDGGANLSNGIIGVWDRYQDYYGGTTANPAPTVSVLIPFNCSDLSP